MVPELPTTRSKPFCRIFRTDCPATPRAAPFPPLPPPPPPRHSARVFLHLLEAGRRDGARIVPEEPVRQPDSAQLEAVQRLVARAVAHDQLGAPAADVDEERPLVS